MQQKALTSTNCRKTGFAVRLLCFSVIYAPQTFLLVIVTEQPSKAHMFRYKAKKNPQKGQLF